MPRGRHKKKSRTKHGRRHGKTKHRRRKSRSHKKHRTRERRHRRRGRKEEEEEEEGEGHRKRHKSAEAMLKQRPRLQIRHPEMTDAAMNENLGNIVLVKNRHKHKSAEGGSADNVQRGGPDRLLSALGPPGPGSTITGGTTTPSTTTTPLTTLPGSDLPDAQPIPLAVQQAQALAYPPGTVPPQQQPAAAAPTLTSTTTPSTTTYGTTGVTPVQTGSTDVSMTGATTTATTTTTTKTSGAPAQASAEKNDELTKKEVADGEKRGCDRLRKWKTYMEKTLDGGVESMVAEFRVIRGHLPPMATRFGFDANMDKNRFEDVVCIDHTRVRLDQGRYIHASWVAITGSRKAILTQLPRPETSGDFWQMILDTDAQAILLILTHAEYKMFHANATFPQEQDFLTCCNSKICVGEFKRVVINRDWTMHVLSVRSGDKRRFLHLHHYSGWVHGRQPPRILDLWQIQSVFRRYTHPHVYMSLSGCGRAGTYAAFEIAHERLHLDHFSKLSIADCVCRARNGRMHSVQRPIQMQTIHACIMEHIMGNRFFTLLSHGRRKKYKEFATRFDKCAELQEDL